MRYFPDDDYGVDQSHIDPLERARQALDFEAYAKTAPSVKDILFQAQTMGPLPNVRQAWRPQPKAFALAFCALLLLAPWLPIRSSLTVMQIGFEREIARADADKLAAHLVRNQPWNVLLQSEFKPSDPGQLGYNVPGHLRVKLTAFNSGEERIEQEFKSLISNYQGHKLAPLFTLDQNVETSGLHSPALLALSLLKAQAPQRLHLPDQSQVLAQLARKSQPLLASAVAPKIEGVAGGLKVRDVRFGLGGGSKSDYDFSVPAWPEPMNFRVEGFDGLDGERKSMVMSAAADFLGSANLGVAVPAILGDVPLQVTVYGLDTEADPVLTGRVQSWIQQPEDDSRLTLSIAKDLVAKAMDEALPHQNYTATYQRSGDHMEVSITLERFRSGVFEKVDEAADDADSPAGEI